MGTGENKVGSNSGGDDDQVAKDVARLYAWANVEGVPYRDFSRQRRLPHGQDTVPTDDQRAEISANPSEIVEANVSPLRPIASDAPETAATATIHPDKPVKVESASMGEADAREQAPEPPGASQFSAQRMRSRARFSEEGLPQPAGNEGMPPVLAVHSIAGGVGKTTLCANLGRILCSLGEQVLLVDASGSGILPFYFGANDLRPGLRKFVAPGMTYSPLRVIGTEEMTAEWLGGDLRSAMLTSDRTIFDLGPASYSLLPEIFGMCTTILVPLLPDLNSILTIPRIEASVNKMRNAGLTAPAPYYVFTEFDSDSAMDRRARELVADQCGERLLPLSIRYGAEAGEAIASRMTVVDHAPESDVTHDYVELANWLRRLAPARQATKALGRWTEQ